MVDKKKRLEELKEQKFMLDMVDHWEREDYERWNKLTNEIMELEHELLKEVLENAKMQTM